MFVALSIEYYKALDINFRLFLTHFAFVDSLNHLFIQEYSYLK